MDCKLTEYSPDIRHISGSTNIAADALSRQNYNDVMPTGNDPVSLFCMRSNSYTHDIHIPRLHSIDASSDIGASYIFESSQSDDTKPIPTDPNNWTLDICKRSMDPNYLHDTK